MRDAQDALAEGVEITADEGGADARLERRGEGGDRAAAGDAHAADASRVQLVARLDPVDRAHDVVGAPRHHGFAQQQGGPGGGPARGRTELLGLGSWITPAAEADLLDRNRRQAVLDALDGEVVLVAVFVGAVAALVVDADDIIDATSVTRQADHRTMRRLG